MTIVPMPPTSTAATGPNNAASNPDSNSPSWLEVPVVSECAALTRPRMASGVRSCTSECRNDDAEEVGGAEHRQRSQRQRQCGGDAEDDRGEAKDDDAAE